MKEITCEKILIEWLKEHPNSVIAHHDIDGELPKYGRERFAASYSFSTYHRNFCWLKNDPKTLRENDLEIEPLVEGSGKKNTWKVKSLVQVEMEALELFA